MFAAEWKAALLLGFLSLIRAQSGMDGSGSVPPYIALFDATEYEFDINISSPIGTIVFEALFIINPNVTVEYLSFDIIMMDDHEMVGESSVDENFLINGTTPPLVIQQAPFQSIYLLTIATNSVLDTNDTMDITFNLFAFINISTGIVGMPRSNVTLHKIDPCNECTINSTCEPQLDGSVNCVCPTGYNGTSCSNYIGQCISNPCANNGTCMDNVNGYSCVCADGFTSTNCTINIDDCDPNPCMNGGKCQGLINNYVCQCASGYAGRNCNSRGCSSDIDMWDLEWPSTIIGNTATYPCYMSNATRMCMEGSEWSVSKVDDCQTETYKLLEERVMEDIDADLIGLIEYTSNLSNLTSTLSPILPQDLMSSSNILDAVINSALKIDDPDVVDMRALANIVAATLNNLLNNNSIISFEVLSKENISIGATLLFNSKRIGHLLARSLNRTSNCTIERNSIVFNAMFSATETLNANKGVEFPGETELYYSDVRGAAEISIPTAILSQFSSEEQRPPVITVIIQSINLKLPSMNMRSPLDITLCSEISNDPIRTVQQINDSNVEIYFKIKDMENSDSKAVCAFWDFSSNLNGKWSTNGVTTRLINSSYVQCLATHLACFAILSDASGIPGRDTLVDDDDNNLVALYIGCGISIFFILLTMLLLLIFRKKLFTEVKDFIHFNVLLSLLLSLIILIIGIEVINGENVTCIILGILLHYTLMSAFCWMFCEGILIYIFLYNALYEGFFRKWIFFMILGWGIPAPIVGITIGIFSYKEYETDEACWLSEDNHAIWGFIVPVGLITLVTFFSSIIYSQKICKTDKYYLTDTREKRFNIAKDLLKTEIFLLPVVSGTWIIGLFAVNKSSIVYSYVFAALKLIQGIFIISFYVILPYIRVLHKDDDDDDDIEVGNEVRIAEDKALKGYRFSFSAGIAGKKVTIRRASSAKVNQKKVSGLVRRQSLSEYNEAIRNEYISSSTKEKSQQKSVSFDTIVEEHEERNVLSRAKDKVSENASQGNNMALRSKEVEDYNTIEFENTKL